MSVRISPSDLSLARGCSVWTEQSILNVILNVEPTRTSYFSSFSCWTYRFLSSQTILLNHIVDRVAELPSSKLCLHNLSITDRAFTRCCQAYIFKDLHLGGRWGSNRNMSEKLAKIRNILNDEPLFANRVRAIHLTITEKRNKWLFDDPDFITIIQLLVKSLMPLHILHLAGYRCSFVIEDPILRCGMADAIIFFSDSDCPRPHLLRERSINPFPCLSQPERSMFGRGWSVWVPETMNIPTSSVPAESYQY